MERQRRSRKPNPIVVAVSGGFDPLHYGHIQLIQSAKKLGDELVVIINNDNFLIRKKGYYFLSQHDRARIVQEIKGVDTVYISDDEDDTVCKALTKIRPEVFANGGDRVAPDSEESKVCDAIYCKQVFGIGGHYKINSSTRIVKDFVERLLASGNALGNSTP